MSEGRLSQGRVSQYRRSFLWVLAGTGSAALAVVGLFSEELKDFILDTWRHSDVWHKALFGAFIIALGVLGAVFWNLLKTFDAVRLLQIRNDELLLKIDTDERSGLSSYEFLKSRFAAEYIPDSRSGSCFSVLMIDLINFKSINDTYGHTAGDAVISFFGGFLKSFVRGRRDMAARFGQAADEFFFIISGDEGALSGFANRLRRELADEHLINLSALAGQSIELGFWSSGTVVQDGDTWESVERRLMEGLVSAKSDLREDIVIVK